MNANFSAYNAHRHSSSELADVDNHLITLKNLPYLYRSPILDELPQDIPGIYSVAGGRQVGKTTLLKQWIEKLIKEGVEPLSIMFFTGELIDDHHALVSLVQDFIQAQQHYQHLYILIDEITYIKNWDKGIKFLADAGLFVRCTVVLTGSDLLLMQQARMTFPGRRGKADKVDFHIYALSFKEVLNLKNAIPDLNDYLNLENQPSVEVMQVLYQEFESYLKHGGYLTAINDLAQDGKINIATLKTYSDWIRGDTLKRGKEESYLREIIQAVIESYNKQVSWHSLADNLSIDSHKTVAEYCELLARMDALFIQKALLQNKLVGAPKKAKKITFTDPFIYHALKHWLNSEAAITPYEQICLDVANPAIASELVESVVSNQFRRYYPTYYIKADSGEVDVAYVEKQSFYPIEVKWRNQLRPADIKKLSKYPDIRVFAKTYADGEINNIRVEPLPLALLRSDR